MAEDRVAEEGKIVLQAHETAIERFVDDEVAEAVGDANGQGHKQRQHQHDRVGAM